MKVFWILLKVFFSITGGREGSRSVVPDADAVQHGASRERTGDTAAKLLPKVNGDLGNQMKNKFTTWEKSRSNMSALELYPRSDKWRGNP